MTDSTERDRGHKRDRLITSATDLLWRQGVLATTLAHVAQAADVPLGNVYYYFKTKDDLVRAVIDLRTDQTKQLLGALDELPSPADRLKSLARNWSDMRDVVAQFGCPIGSLSAELEKREDELSAAAAALVGLIIDWAQDQFRLMGAPEPREKAISLFAGVQGGALLASTLNEPDIMIGQVHQLERWIDTFA